MIWSKELTLNHKLIIKNKFILEKKINFLSRNSTTLQYIFCNFINGFTCRYCNTHCFGPARLPTVPGAVPELVRSTVISHYHTLHWSASLGISQSLPSLERQKTLPDPSPVFLCPYCIRAHVPTVPILPCRMVAT